MGQVTRCDRCGKFRRVVDTVRSDHGDGPWHEEVTECRWCMSPAELIRYTTRASEGMVGA